MRSYGRIFFMESSFKNFVLIFCLVSCSEPQLLDKDINEIAIITCNILSETRELNSAGAIKELNYAREKIGQERFLGSSETIKKSFDYDLCPSLVKNNDSEYEKIYSQHVTFDLRKSRINRQSTKIKDSIKEIDKIFDYFKVENVEDVPAGTKLAKILKFKNKAKTHLDSYNYSYHITQDFGYENYKRKSSNLLNEFETLEKTIFSANQDIDFINSRIDEIWKITTYTKRENLTYDEYFSFCYKFSETNPINLNFPAERFVYKEQLNPAYWDFLISEYFITKIDNFCTINLLDNQDAIISKQENL